MSNEMSDESDLRQKCLDVEAGFLDKQKLKKQVKAGLEAKFRIMNSLLDRLATTKDSLLRSQAEFNQVTN